MAFFEGKIVLQKKNDERESVYINTFVSTTHLLFGSKKVPRHVNLTSFDLVL